MNPGERLMATRLVDRRANGGGFHGVGHKRF
jgi:hypothetical protein